MNNSDQVKKDIKILFDGIKESLNKKMIIATKTKFVELNDQQLNKILQLINMSIDESYQKDADKFHASLLKYFKPLTKSKKQ